MELSPGMRGKNVADLQRRLVALGFYRGPLDGVYGPALRNAVAEFRGVHGLGEGGGVADEETLAVLHSGHAAARAEPGAASDAIDADEIQRHMEHLHRVALEDDAPTRRRMLAEAFMEFGARFLFVLGRWVAESLAAAENADTPDEMRRGIESRRGVLEGLGEEASHTLLSWLGGEDYTDSVEEPERRARVALMLIDDMSLAGLSRLAARAILALPDRHPLRNADKARDALLGHLQRARATGDTPDALLALTEILQHRLVTRDVALELIELGKGTVEQVDDAQDRRNFWLAVMSHFMILAYRERDRLETESSPGREPAGNLADLKRFRTSAEEAMDRAATESEQVEPEAVLRVRARNRYGLAGLYAIDRPERAAEIFDEVANGGTLEDDTLCQAARLGAKLYLAQDRPERTCALLEPWVDHFEGAYLTAVTEEAIRDAAESLEEVLLNLALAHAFTDRWDRVVTDLGRGRSLRLRYRAALRKTPAGERLQAIEAELYSLARGLQPSTAPPDRARDWIGADVTPAIRLREEYRRLRPRLDHGLATPTVEELAAALGPNEALAILAVTWKGLLITIVCPGDRARPSGCVLLSHWTRADFARLLMGEHLDGWAMALGGRVDPPLDPRQPLAGLIGRVDEIGEAIAAVLCEKGLGKITLVPDAWLSYLPFWTLPSLEELTVGLSPSPAHFVDRADVRVRVEHALVVSDPTQDLPVSLAEGASVASHLAGSGVEMTALERDGATEGRLEGLLRRAQLLHFAGHGRTVISDPLASALELSPDWQAAPIEGPGAFAEIAERVTEWERPHDEVREASIEGTGRLREIEDPQGDGFQRWLEYSPKGTLWGRHDGVRWGRIAELWSAGDVMSGNATENVGFAFLSACSSGGPAVPAFDGETGLVAALQLAGVPTIVSSLWPVPDALTAVYVDLFYEQIAAARSSVDVAEVTRRTSCALRTMNRQDALRRIGTLRERTGDVRARFGLDLLAREVESGQDPPFAHPHDWGAFYVTGRARLTLGSPA